MEQLHGYKVTFGIRIYNLTTSNPSNGINNTMKNDNSNNY